MVTAFDGSAGEVAGGATAVNPPAVATGFNVYIGATDATVTLQNSTPIAIGQTFTVHGRVVTGTAAGMGQTPDIYVTGGPMLRRG